MVSFLNVLSRKEAFEVSSDAIWSDVVNLCEVDYFISIVVSV